MTHYTEKQRIIVKHKKVNKALLEEVKVSKYVPGKHPQRLRN